MERSLWLMMIIYAAASWLHFAHNAVFIRDYPNLPGWITPLGIWLSWCAIAALGAMGYWLYRRISRRTGLLVIAFYALLGFGGLDHYAIAPVSAHSLAMNATIVVEVLSAAGLLILVACLALPVLTTQERPR